MGFYEDVNMYNGMYERTEKLIKTIEGLDDNSLYFWLEKVQAEVDKRREKALEVAEQKRRDLLSYCRQNHLDVIGKVENENEEGESTEYKLDTFHIK